MKPYANVSRLVEASRFKRGASGQPGRSRQLALAITPAAGEVFLNPHIVTAITV